MQDEKEDCGSGHNQGGEWQKGPADAGVMDDGDMDCLSDKEGEHSGNFKSYPAEHIDGEIDCESSGGITGCYGEI
jgi:hypothetical protein